MRHKTTQEARELVKSLGWERAKKLMDMWYEIILYEHYADPSSPSGFDSEISYIKKKFDTLSEAKIVAIRKLLEGYDQINILTRYENGDVGEIVYLKRDLPRLLDMADRKGWPIT